MFFPFSLFHFFFYFLGHFRRTRPLECDSLNAKGCKRKGLHRCHREFSSEWFGLVQEANSTGRGSRFGIYDCTEIGIVVTMTRNNAEMVRSRIAYNNR